MNRIRSTALLAAFALLGACQDNSTAPASVQTPALARNHPSEGYATPGEVRTGYISGPDGRPMKITYEVHDGLAVWQGDMILGPASGIAKTADELTPAGGARRGVVINTAGSRWPGGIIPFVIDAGLPNQARVNDAIAHIEANTDIVDFVPRTTQGDYVRIVSSPDACSAPVGHVGGIETVNLAAGCTTGATIHELLHITGMWHEQSRCDRNTFVQINFGNIQAGREHNFDNYCTNAVDVFAYDEGSIMHYGPFDFSSNGQATITSLRGLAGMMGQRNGMSAIDRQTVDWMYPRPFSASISGKQNVALHESSLYTAGVAGGTGPFTYEWRSRQSGPSTSGTWSGWFSTGSTNSTYASINSCGLNTNYLEVRVTDATARQTTGSYTIFITNPC
ncbi:MAG TPA: M12 family metallopeptidase [Longimicrobiaceae bacterium]|nr:M12 family metallopeptidase [Longimicrobiaceae bacterium]